MPPKTPKTPTTPNPRTPSKLNRNQPVESKLCSTCSSIYFPQNIDKHEIVCSKIASKEYQLTENHAFVAEKQFFTTCEDIDKYKCPVECFKRAVRVMNVKILLMSPVVMKLCSIRITDHILVETLDGLWQSTFFVFPCQHQNPSSTFANAAVLKGLPKDCGNKIKISGIRQNNFAKAVHLKLTIPIPVITKKMENSFLDQYEEHPVTKGTSLIIKDLGKTWMVTVTKVISTGEPPEPVDELEEKMKALAIHEPTYSLILPTTKIFFESSAITPSSNENTTNIDHPILGDFAGNQAVLKEVMKMCENVFLQTLNRNVPKGILLYGPSGTGKSLLVKAVSNHFKVHLVQIQGAELYSKYYGETESRLKAKFDEAINK